MGKIRRETARQLRLAAANQALSDALKAALGCELTGQRLPVGDLAWHHVDPATKKFDLSRYARSKTAFYAELCKCVCIAHPLHEAIHAKTKICLGTQPKTADSPQHNPDAAANSGVL